MSPGSGRRDLFGNAYDDGEDRGLDEGSLEGAESPREGEQNKSDRESPRPNRTEKIESRKTGDGSTGAEDESGHTGPRFFDASALGGVHESGYGKIAAYIGSLGAVLLLLILLISSLVSSDGGSSVSSSDPDAVSPVEGRIEMSDLPLVEDPSAIGEVPDLDDQARPVPEGSLPPPVPRTRSVTPPQAIPLPAAEEPDRSDLLLVPSGTRLSFRLDETIDSGTASPGQSWSGRLVEQVQGVSGVAFASSSRVSGVILAIRGESRGIVLKPTQVFRSGENVNLRANSIAGGEMVEEGGGFPGKETAIGAAVGAVAGAIFGGKKGAAVGAVGGGAAGAAAGAARSSRRVVLRAGTVLSTQLVEDHYLQP